MTKGIAYSHALAHAGRGDAAPVREGLPDRATLLSAFHPDCGPDARATLVIGPDRGAACHPELARVLQANALVDDVTLAGTSIVDCDVLVVGGGGAGCAAAMEASRHGASVTLVTKLGLGDSNTVMAEGGIQAAVGAGDSLQAHYADTMRAGHLAGDRDLVASMVRDAPDAIHWLMRQGMAFDREGEGAASNALLRRRVGGATEARLLSYRDFTGLEMMRVLREAVALDSRIAVHDEAAVVELLTDGSGGVAGAIVYDLNSRAFNLVRAAATILATGGAGRLHLGGFPTSNHYGATADGLVLAYRAGARVRDVDSFQYHPTGLAWPRHLVGALVSEAARSQGARLLNGLGERFVDELAPRDVVAAAILRECAQGRGVERDDGLGVMLDTPGLERVQPGILARRLVTLSHIARRCGFDPAVEPLLVYPTLHYQNGGVAIDVNGKTGVPRLWCAGEIAGGIHGRNRMMGNALLELIVFGRRAGRAAAAMRSDRPVRTTLDHVRAWQRDLVEAGLPLDVHAPALYPTYSGFDINEHRHAERRGPPWQDRRLS
jgi:L-aspartate oxidase